MNRNDKREIAIIRKNKSIWSKIRWLIKIISKRLEEKTEDNYVKSISRKHMRTSGYGKF
mgnify:CR=1 FL=1